MSTPSIAPAKPEFFRIPRSGERDPHFGLARSFYYAAEAEGLLRLHRVRMRGRSRGVVLVPYNAVLELIGSSVDDHNAQTKA